MRTSTPKMTIRQLIFARRSKVAIYAASRITSTRRNLVTWVEGGGNLSTVRNSDQLKMAKISYVNHHLSLSKHLKGRSVLNKGFCHFPVSRHFSGRSVPPCSGRVCLTFLFLDTFPLQKCLETGKRTKSRERNHYFQGIWSFFLFPKTLTFQKCLETGKTTKSLEKMIIVKGFCCFSCF